MVILKNELKLSIKSFLIWTSTIALLMIMCVAIYPQMKEEMLKLSESFSQMGDFSKAFNLDQLNFATFMGYYSVEIGNVIGLTGACFGAIVGALSLSKEETNKTSELLFTSPVSRTSVMTSKLLSCVVQVVALNVILYLITLPCCLIVTGELDLGDYTLLHLSYLILQLEVMGISYFFSSFVKRGSVGISLGIVGVFYILSIFANLSDSLTFLTYLTPYSYTDGAYIISNHNLDYIKVLIGLCFSIVLVIIAYYYYPKKDIK